MSTEVRRADFLGRLRGESQLLEEALCIEKRRRGRVKGTVYSTAWRSDRVGHYCGIVSNL